MPGGSRLAAWESVLLSLWLLLGAGAALAQTGAPAPTVAVVPVASREITDTADLTGRITAIDKVDIIARVTGFLEQRLFTEGSTVKKDDLLYRIEQATYKAAVDQARAALARAKATAVNADLQLARARELVRNQNIPQATVDQRVADLAAAQADILAAQASLDQAEINFGYTEIRSPIEGRIGISNFTVGNLVTPSSGVLVTIVSQNPIYVIFQASERDILAYRRQIAASGAEPGRVTVHIRMPDGTIYPEPGLSNFLDIQVDQTTDTVAVRAQLPNPQGLLVPGGFVTVIVDRGPPRKMLVVPQAALQIDQAGRYVLVVGTDKKVEVRRVTVGAEQGRDVAVTDGLKEGEDVIVEGIQKVRPGQVVAPAPATGR
jgi:membrane fusion protein (multidrug efflux system)